MKSTLLFPPVFRIIGLVLALPGLALGYLFEYTNYLVRFLRYGNDQMANGSDTFTDELVITLVITGLVFIGFSKLKNESETTTKLRLNALYWSVLANCILLTGFFIFQSLGYLLNSSFIKQNAESGYWLIGYNFCVPLLIFVSRFYHSLYKSKKHRTVKPVNFLPYKPYNLIGKIVSVPFIILSIAAIISPMISVTRILGIEINDVIYFGFPPFLLLWIWSKEKNEIAYVKNIRLKAMQIAVYINYGLFVVATWVIYGFDYITVMLMCLTSIQIIFIIVFYYQLYKMRKEHTKIALTNL